MADKPLTEYQEFLLKMIHEHHDKNVPIVHHINPGATDHTHDEEFLEVLEIVKTEGYTVVEDKPSLPPQTHLCTLTPPFGEPCSAYDKQNVNMLVGGAAMDWYWQNPWYNHYPLGYPYPPYRRYW